VFVDAAHEDEPKRAPRFMLGHTAPRWLWHPIWAIAQTARVLGIIRLLTPRGELADDPAKRSQQEILQALRRQPKSIATHADASTPESYAEAEAADGLGDRPLIVLTQGKIPSTPHPTEMDREYAAYLQVWMHEIQPKLARLSSKGRQVIVEKSGHGIPTEAPEFVIAAVRDVVADVRNAGGVRRGGGAARDASGEFARVVRTLLTEP
jgi:pimeloyl-ACP methyl ester carboxylesterase